MRVIGTAGHVDHGKSTLIEALTGSHPDRLKEEIEREMTIDLGFGWWSLANGEELGVVDVPGHRDFIENMLAGVGGIDAVLFVVAADEGIMPQTREHLAILNLLKIPAGIVVITKIDMVDDPEWIDLVEEELLTAMEHTILQDAPIARVSAKTGEGLDELQQALINVLEAQPRRNDLGRPRLAVDRTFSITGFGTIATGTLLDGVFKTGDEVEILPDQVKARIRGLQTHKRKTDIVLPGSRTAVNLSGIDLDEIKRGDVVAYPGTIIPTGRVDVQFDLLPDASHPLKHNDEVKFFIGTAERIARVRLIGVEQMMPGERGWLQIETKEQVVCFRGDRFILRRPSPGETIGGGSILEANPGKRYKRFDKQILQKLAALEKGDPQNIILENMSQSRVITVGEAKAQSGVSEEDFTKAIQALISSGAAIIIQSGKEVLDEKDLIISKSSFTAITDRLNSMLTNYHAEFPLKPGIPQEELSSRLKLEQKAVQALSTLWGINGVFEFKKGFINQHGFKIEFTAKQQALIDILLEEIEKTPASPPTYKTSIETAGADIVQALLFLGVLVRISPEVIYHQKDLKRIIDLLVGLMKQEGRITAAQARDALGTTRRYALALLEHMDSLKITTRVGDYRVLSEHFSNNS